MKVAVDKGRATRPDLELGICGEHGGDPASIHKCEAHRARLRVVLAVPRPGRAARRRPGRPRRTPRSATSSQRRRVAVGRDRRLVDGSRRYVDARRSGRRDTDGPLPRCRLWVRRSALGDTGALTHVAHEFIDALNAIQTGLGEVPVPVLAAILLGGPTLLWLAGSGTSSCRPAKEAVRRPATTLASSYWICERCRSANDVPGAHCYHCGIDQAETTRRPADRRPADRLIVVDGVPVVRELAPLDRPLIPVGPGNDPFAPCPAPGPRRHSPRGGRRTPLLERLMDPDEEWAQEPLFERLAGFDEDWSPVTPDVAEPPPVPVPVAKPPRRAVVVGAADATSRRRKRSSVSQTGTSPKGGRTRAEGLDLSVGSAR